MIALQEAVMHRRLDPEMPMGSPNIEDNDRTDSESASDTEEELDRTRSCEAIERIEDMVTSLLTQLAFAGPSFRTHSTSDETSDSTSEAADSSARVLKGKSRIELQLVDRNKEMVLGAANYKYLRYPRKSSTGSAKPFAQLFRVLDLAHEAITHNIPTTKRDVYYKDVTLFKHQRTVDNLVDDLAATFELERSDLHIRAASKGLICGAGLTIHLITGETIKVNDTEGVLIPLGEDIASFSVDRSTSWVLIVEKEAVFQTLCRLSLTTHPSLPGGGLIITGKGYPDVATRHLVKTLGDALPLSVPIFALVDGDPYGIDILSVYRYGSRSLQHESKKLAARRIRWLGLWSSELDDFGIDRDRLLPITKQDEKKALSMLQTRGMPRKWKKELMHMLHNRRKAEIEILTTMNSRPSADNRQRLGNVSSLQCSPSHDAKGAPGNDRTGSPFSDYSNSASSDPSTPAILRYSSPPTTLPVHCSSAPAHSPLVWYLVRKIPDFVAQAEARTNAMEIDARTL